MQTEQEVNRVVEQYADTVRRLCMVRLKNRADAEDVFQTVFLKFALRNEPFESPAHEKAWLIKVTLNACRDLLRSFFRTRTVSLDELVDEPAALSPETHEALEAVLSLPQKYRDAVYLHYYEGYTAPEIASIVGKNVNTIYTRLGRARSLLREKLGGDIDG